MFATPANRVDPTVILTLKKYVMVQSIAYPAPNDEQFLILGK